MVQTSYRPQHTSPPPYHRTEPAMNKKPKACKVEKLVPVHTLIEYDDVEWIPTQSTNADVSVLSMKPIVNTEEWISFVSQHHVSVVYDAPTLTSSAHPISRPAQPKQV